MNSLRLASRGLFSLRCWRPAWSALPPQDPQPASFSGRPQPSESSEPSCCKTLLKPFPFSSFHSSAFVQLEAAAEQRSPPSERVERVAAEIVQMNLLEVADLTELLRVKLKITEMPMMNMGGGGMAAPSGGAAAPAAEEPKEEKSVFDVKLEKFEAANKIKIIKEVRGMTSLGLKEAKDLVEKTPVVIKAGVSKAEAEEIIKKLQAVGGTSKME